MLQDRCENFGDNGHHRLQILELLLFAAKNKNAMSHFSYMSHSPQFRHSISQSSRANSSLPFLKGDVKELNQVLPAMPHTYVALTGSTTG